MKEKKTFSGWRKALIITSSVLCFLFLCLFGAELWLKHRIRAAVEKEATALMGSGTKVGMGRISVNIRTRSVTVHDIRLKMQNNEPVRSGSALVSLDAGVEKVSIHGIGYKKKAGRPAVNAAAVEIISPYATVITQGGKPENGKAKKSVRQIVTEKFNSIAIGEIRVEGTRLDYVAWEEDGSDGIRVGIENGDLKVDGFLVDSLPAIAGEILFSDDITFTADRISYAYDSGDFVLKADTVSLNVADGSFYLKTASLIPQYPKDEFARESAKHSDWTEFSLHELTCVGVDYAGLADNMVLAVDSLSFASGHVASYKNRQVWQKPRVKPMLYQTIQDLPFGVDIKRMSFTGLDIEYDELAADGDSPGTVVFTDGSGTAFNLTNIAENHDRFMTIDITADLMESGSLHAGFLFPVSPQDDHWEMKGTLGKMDPAALNGAIEPLASIRVKTGVIQGVDFHVTGTLMRSRVDLTMLYDNLSLAFMKKHGAEERKFVTFMADEIILKKNNPGHNGKVRTGKGDFTRDPHKSMYNFMWKSLFQGIKDTVL